ncbi:MAG TPA: N-6 DNA methylase [Bdellovibrionota bacterium]|nr:N-6 DNA methylase [Bdellovibrionota bacterium]
MFIEWEEELTSPNKPEPQMAFPFPAENPSVILRRNCEAIPTKDLNGHDDKDPSPSAQDDNETVQDDSPVILRMDPEEVPTKDLKAQDDETISAPPTKDLNESKLLRDLPTTLNELLNYLFNDIFQRRFDLLQLNPSRRRRILHDLEQIMGHFSKSPNIDLQESDYQATIFSDDPDIHRAITIFCHRVAHNTLLRFMLIKYWLDLGLLKPHEVRFSDLNWTISKVLSYGSQNLIADRHSWLFVKQNSYSWYRHPDELGEVISKRLEPFEFTTQTVDLLNILYESYLRHATDNLYGHLTPTPIVRFTWDKLLTNEDGDRSLFRTMGLHRQPKLVFDPAIGSGNFLAETARQMNEELKADYRENSHWKELANAITTGLYGCDLDPFAHLFAELKLLWLLSPALLHQMDAVIHNHHSTLSIIHQNSLKLHCDDQLKFDSSESIQELRSDIRFNVLPLEGHLKTVHWKIKNSARFDFVACCPPESDEDRKAEFLKEMMAHSPYWQEYYTRGMDYSYWFFILGLSKLREGGRMGIVTHNYWPTSEGGNKLRKFLLENSRILEIIDIGERSLEENGTKIPRYITIMERCSDKEKRDTNKIKITKIKPDSTPLPLSDLLSQIFNESLNLTAPGQVVETDHFHIFYSAIPQSELDHHPWTIIQESGFSQVLQHIAKTKTTLGTLCFLERGEGFLEQNRNQDKSVPTLAQEFLATSEMKKSNQFSLHKEASSINPRDIILIKRPNTRESLKYIQAILNSSLATFWYQHNGDQRSGKLVYTIQTLKMMPIRSILFANHDGDEVYMERKQRILSTIKRKDFSFLEASLKLELETGHEELVHDAIMGMMDEIEVIRRQRRKYQPLVTINEQSETDISNISLYPIFPRDRLCALRDHPAIHMEVCGETNIQTFCLANISREAGLKYEQEHLMLIGTEGGVLKLYAPKDLLDLLQVFLLQRTHEFWEEFSQGILLPSDLHLWEAQKYEILNTFKSLEELEEQCNGLIDQVVCRLYGFNPSATDEHFQKFSRDALAMIKSGGQRGD